MRVGMCLPCVCPCVCVCVCTHIACVLCFAQFVLLVLMPVFCWAHARPGVDFIPVLFRHVVRPLRKLLFCLMICAQSRNWGRRSGGTRQSVARSWPTMGENMENYWNNNFFAVAFQAFLPSPPLIRVCSAKGEAKQQNTKSDDGGKRKHKKERKKQEKKRDKIWKFLFINFATVSRVESSLSIDFLGHRQRSKGCWKSN